MVKVDRTYTAKNLVERGKYTPKFIVLHDTAGNGGLGDVKYLANDPEGRGISVDYCVPKDGKIYKLNPDIVRYGTNHAGRATSFRGVSGSIVNRSSIGIEIGQKADITGLNPLYPEVQVKSVGELCRKLCDDFELTKTDITTHAKIITDRSRSDPRQWPWDLFWVYFDGEEKQPIYHVVEAGDTLWSLSRKYLTSVESLKAMNSMNDRSNIIRVGQKLLVKE